MGLHKSIEKRNVCAKCGKIMDLKNYHIQLCRSCREEELEKEIKINMQERKANLRHLIRVEDYLLDGKKECKTKISKENNIPIEVIGDVFKYLINRGFMETKYKNRVTLYYLNEDYINKLKEVRNEKENEE